MGDQLRDLIGFKKTRSALIVSSLFHEPLACLFIWLPFILRKDCQATAWQISLLATLKPLVSILSFYWSQITYYFGMNPSKSVLLSGIFARILFLFFPFFHSIEFILIASSFYLFFARAGLPSWMEMLKLNLEPKMREKWFSLSSMLGYAEGIFLAIGLGSLFDQTLSAWRYLFSLSALLGILATIYQTFVPKSMPMPIKRRFNSVWQLVYAPIKDTLFLMKKRKDFALFQWGFMAAGFGIMLANVICPLFFVDVLGLKHVEFAHARYIFMGLGFILFSPLWQKGMQNVSIYGLTLKICFGFAVFISLVFLSNFDIRFLYGAFFLYGASQAGSHLIWHLSGPIFSKEEDSTIFSSVNLVMVGLRGLIGPILGSMIYLKIGPFAVFSLAISCCIFGGMLMLKERKSFYRAQPSPLEREGEPSS